MILGIPVLWLSCLEGMTKYTVYNLAFNFFRVVSSGTSAPLVPLLRRFEQISCSKVGPLNASWDENAQIVVS